MANAPMIHALLSCELLAAAAGGARAASPAVPGRNVPRGRRRGHSDR